MRRKNSIIRALVSILVFFIIFLSDYQLVKIYKDYRKSDLLYENVQSTFSTVKGENDIEIDFQKLQKENSDIVGWIYFENEDISYPLLYSGDDEKYLRTAYTGENMTAGSIFIEGANNPDFSDSHTIIYGHNMKNLSMFGKLKYYKQKENYYQEHQCFKIITPEAVYRYKIFSYREVDANSDVYTVKFENDESFKDFVDNVLLTDTSRCADDEVTEESKVITLSTCSENGKRFIVTAVFLKNY